MLNEKKFREIYNEYVVSGLTIKDYCANQQMNEAKFYYWQNKLKDQLPPKRGFVPLVFEHEKKTSQIPVSRQNIPDSGSYRGIATRQIFCEISLPNGVCIKLNGLLDAEMLQSLMILTRQ